MTTVEESRYYNRRVRMTDQRNRNLNNLEPVVDTIHGVVFAIGGSIFSDRSDSYVWVHEWGALASQLQAYVKPGVGVWEGAGVVLQRSPRPPYELEIVATHINPMPRSVIENTQINRGAYQDHNYNHQWPTEATKGRDAVGVWPPALQLLKAVATEVDLDVVVGPLYYGLDATRKFFPLATADQTIDLTSHLPSAGNNIRVLVYLDTATGLIATTASAQTTGDPAYPDTPSGGIASAYFHLTNGQTVLDMETDYVEARRFLTENAGGSGSGNPFAEAIDATVTDAVTADMSPAALLRHNTTGTPADKLGTSIEFYAESSTTEDTIMAEFGARWNDVAHGTRSSEFVGRAVHDEVLYETFVMRPSWAGIVGNARGVGSFDFQAARTAATQVVSGWHSGALGGYGNTISADYAAALGGHSNILSGYYSSIVGGYQNEISVTSQKSVILGGDNNIITTADAIGILAGEAHIATDAFCAIIGGRHGRTAYEGQVLAGPGDSAIDGSPSFQGTIQGMAIRSIASHTDTTWYDLYVTGTTLLSIPSNRLVAAIIIVAGRRSGQSDSWTYRVDATISNVSGTVSVLSQVVTPLYESDAAYDVQLAASTSYLAIQVRRDGGTDYAINWAAKIMTVEVSS